MRTETLFLSSGFRRLYCDASTFDSFSVLHPISFRRVLPFQSGEPLVDNRQLIEAEESHLAEKCDATRQGVVEGYFKCGLLQEAEVIHLKAVVDFFGADFFELMGLVYANAGMFRCALRWYRELIRELETSKPDSRSDEESVYASVGYCLYSLGLFAEAIAWSKSCIGPRQVADAVCQTLIAYEMQLAGGVIQAIERSGSRTRYTLCGSEQTDFGQNVARLKEMMDAFAPFQDVYIDWTNRELPGAGIQPDGHPFKSEFDGGSLLRHKMNLIFSMCCQADLLVEMGYILEAKRLLCEAAMLAPQACIVQERLKALVNPR